MCPCPLDCSRAANPPSPQYYQYSGIYITTSILNLPPAIARIVVARAYKDHEVNLLASSLDCCFSVGQNEVPCLHLTPTVPVTVTLNNSQWLGTSNTLTASILLHFLTMIASVADQTPESAFPSICFRRPVCYCKVVTVGLLGFFSTRTLTYLFFFLAEE